jgi:putative transposase
MARLALVVVPGLPHHVTQRGNHREPVFFNDGDDAAYLDLISKAALASGTEICAWRLMPNSVHLIMTPGPEGGLRATFARSPAPIQDRKSTRLNSSHFVGS